MSEPARVVLWRSLTGPGLDRCELRRVDDAWRLSGTMLTVAGDAPAAVTYEVTADAGWRTRHVLVEVTLGLAPPVALELHVEGGRWQAARRPVIATPWVSAAALDGLIDVDLAFTPATNLLPIRRLQPAVGASIDVTAAWLRFPELVIEPLPQRYTRLTVNQYRYESDHGAFTARIDVDDLGLVVDYEGLFERLAASTGENVAM